MSTCHTCNVADTNDVLQFKKLNKIISNNYAILFLFLLLLALFGLSFYYIASLLYAQISLFFKSKKKKVFDDDEYYDSSFIQDDVTKYYDTKKKNFIKELNKEYKEYNEEKTKQIQNIFNLDNDDIINEKNIFFNKYDNY